jgi:hypothetical protein
LPTENCPQTRTDLFVQGYVPTKRDDMWQMVKLDSRNGLLACENTPPQFVQQKSYLVYPPEAQEWAKENNVEQPPKECSSLSALPAVITYPRPGDVVTGTVFIVGTASSPGFISYRLDIGKGPSPLVWAPLGLERRTSVENGLLGQLNPTLLRLDDGIYTIRLVVRDKDKGEFVATATFEVRTRPASPTLTPTATPGLRPFLPRSDEDSDRRDLPRLPRQ